MPVETFKATVAGLGARTMIVLPFDPDDAWGAKQKHYVTGTIDGCPIRGCLIFDGARFFLPLGPAWRRDNGVETGADVEVVLGPEGPQPDNISPDVAAALDAEPEARAFFQSLASFYRKNYIRWIEEAKRPETRRGRIEAMMSLLKDGRRRR